MSLIGDPLPAPIARYWDAIDGARFDEAATCFALDAVYAAPPPGAIETDPRHVTVGSTAILERFVDRGPRPWHHEPVLCVVDESTALVEGVLCDDAGRRTTSYVCSARIGDDGLIERFLAFSCSGVRDAIPTDVDIRVEPAVAAEVVHAYFADLDEGRLAEAATHFSEDVLYSHPPYRHTGIDDPDRIEFRGRPALATAFAKRGPTRFDHEVVASVQRGPHCVFEGAVNNLPDGGSGSFISSLSLAADGTIRRYVSFYCEPAVPVR